MFVKKVAELGTVNVATLKAADIRKKKFKELLSDMCFSIKAG
jgi:hypothetical protein